MKWKKTTRKINGKKTQVKVHRCTNGNYLVRKIGNRNRTD